MLKINDLHIMNGVDNDLGIFNKNKNSVKDNHSFKAFLSEAVDRVNELENSSKTYSMKLATGEIENIHEAMIASQKAETSLQFIMEVRNKVLDAYKEIMRMQI
ncbi:flagellar hook-basal body complex protein FliE [Natronincola ferrireducens]|uniref:Flagellar hook-basal body complex protein FliE n=1 Tax=Natronincola ferrireducens TaxID=393762 RepID=A0A1G9C0B2_9FIRM|nr:flagellar hook-basal body complex protein FliE [Natronincola ferrireducens]SDK45126.1 flagellar hook-basal body complex protein FliE [Natronincola ferrireducens]